MPNLVPIVIVASKNVSKETLLLLNSKTETSSQNVVNAILEMLLDVQVVHSVEFQLLKKVIK
jgi:transcriptional regulator CtsR